MNPCLMRKRKRQRYLFCDRFSAVEAAPAETPHAALPGPGGLVLTQNDGSFATDGAKLILAPQTTPAAGDLGFWASDGIARAAGRAILFSFAQSGYGAMNNIVAARSQTLNYGSFANIADGYYLTDTALWTIDSAGYFHAQAGRQSGVILGIVLRAAGAYLLVVEPGGLVTLQAVKHQDSTATVYPALSNGAGSGALRRLEVLDAGGAWATDTIALATVASPTSPQSVAPGVDDVLAQFTWTAKVGEVLEWSFRRTSDDDRYLVRCSQSGSTVKLIKVVGGAETELQSAAQTWTADSAYNLILAVDRGRVVVWTGYGAAKIDYPARADTAFVASGGGTGMVVSGFSVGSNLRVYPRHPPFPKGRGNACRTFLVHGDSKSDMSVSTVTWPHELMAAVRAAHPDLFAVRDCLAVTGWTVANQAACIARDLSVATYVPEFVLQNIGANDLTAMPEAAVWQANLGTVLDAMHAQWPSAKVYVAKPWRSGRDNEADTMAGWIDTVLSTRSAWARVGHDERVWFKPDVASLSADGVHYNAAGNTAAAAQWVTVLGL